MAILLEFKRNTTRQASCNLASYQVKEESGLKKVGMLIMKVSMADKRNF